MTPAVVSTVKMATKRGSLSALRYGDMAHPTVVLLHGWPQSKELHRSVMEGLGEQFHVVVPDLPGIGGSRMDAAPTDKRAIADLVLEAVEGVGGHDVVVAGVDVGGTVAYAAARHHARRVKGVVIMNTVVPGVDPWDAVLAEPHIWHFAFHSTPELPERMVAKRERAYFDFFTDFLSGDPARISEDMRRAFAAAYTRPEALRTGFGWYRSFAEDVRHNAAAASASTPRSCTSVEMPTGGLPAPTSPDSGPPAPPTCVPSRSPIAAS